jgi:deoxyribodipyrimidine photo-lyase
MINGSEMDVFKASEAELNWFLAQNLKQYSRLRNFDFGPDKRNNVSQLSKYISHRVIDEYDVIRATLGASTYERAEKFIQEVFWRVYWKGWLEHRPTVWNDFLAFDQQDKFSSQKDNKNYLAAINGETGIECFDFWAQELRNTNYLHNHARMWFASIWIFTLGLPWQAGAKFFLKHLLDGDAASNTLGWRWVAGIQTIGKCYLARAENISKFTGERFDNARLNERALPLVDEKVHVVQPIDYEASARQKFETLLVMDSNLNMLTRNETKNYKKIYVMSLANASRQIAISQSVVEFKQNLIKSAAQKHPHCEVLDAREATQVLGKMPGCDVCYPFIGENLDFLHRSNDVWNIDLNFLRHHEDLFCWQFATKGFFNFKKNIPAIIKTLALS